MTLVKCEVVADRLPTKSTENEIKVMLYGSGHPAPDIGIVGSGLPSLMERLGVPPSSATVDLVSIAMAVTAADTFVLRELSADRWRRQISIDLPLFRPQIWEPLAPLLAELLGFLSGDSWQFSFRDGGKMPPFKSDVRRRIPLSDPSQSDCVALFSGGLDSALGVTQLIRADRRPLLVSHAATGDASYQAMVAPQLPARMQRVSFNSYPSRSGLNDVSMRTRSFQFLAVAALVADTLHSFRSGPRIELYVCENGLIALNPPLTPRRLGSHSTRTTHPHYISLMQSLFDTAQIPVSIINPHRHETKGEMLLRHANEEKISQFASSTISCGKWKRAGAQCGRCLPCIIRRASFFHAGIEDLTRYRTCRLATALSTESIREDVLSVQVALLRRYTKPFKSWILQSGPLPDDPLERAAYFSVAERGLDELDDFLAHEGLAV